MKAKIVTYRVRFADGGLVDRTIATDNSNEGWAEAVEWATTCHYDGKKRTVQSINVAAVRDSAERVA